jgi:hypothetical protein
LRTAKGTERPKLRVARLKYSSQLTLCVSRLVRGSPPIADAQLFKCWSCRRLGRAAALAGRSAADARRRYLPLTGRARHAREWTWQSIPILRHQPGSKRREGRPH